MNEDGSFTKYEKRIIRALKNRHPYKEVEKEAFKHNQLPCMLVEVVLTVANGVMIVDMPIIGASVCSMGTNMETYQEVFSAFGAELDQIVNNPAGFERKRMQEWMADPE
jgi:hypothetical protein